MSEETEQKPEIKEKSTEIFLIDDYKVIKKLLGYTSYPSRIYLYQMPNKASSYVNGEVQNATDLMNLILEYHRSEEWRIETCLHTTNWKKTNDESISIDVINEKNRKESTITFSDIEEVIVVPDLHSVVIVPKGDNLGDILPNQIIRLVGLVKQNFLKCLLVGEDDPEHEGKRTLSMKFEAVD